MTEEEKEKLFSGALEKIEAENFSFFNALRPPFNKLRWHVSFIRHLPIGGITLEFTTDYLSSNLRQQVRNAFENLW